MSNYIMKATGIDQPPIETSSLMNKYYFMLIFIVLL